MSKTTTSVRGILLTDMSKRANIECTIQACGQKPSRTNVTRKKLAQPPWALMAMLVNLQGYNVCMMVSTRMDGCQHVSEYISTTLVWTERSRHHQQRPSSDFASKQAGTNNRLSTTTSTTYYHTPIHAGVVCSQTASPLWGIDASSAPYSFSGYDPLRLGSTVD